MKKEIWKDIPSYEGLYQVSNWGQVKSLKFGKERLLKLSLNTYGYYKTILNTNKTYTVHQLVAITFLNHKPNGFKTVINHIDNNKLNNNVENLELVSMRYNSTEYRTDVGACYDNSGVKIKRWKAYIMINKKQFSLGYFLTKEEALEMYEKALNNKHLYNGDNNEFRNKLKYDL